MALDPSRRISCNGHDPNCSFTTLLSVPLQKELLLALNRDIIKKVNLFNQLPNPCILAILRCLKPCLYLAGDFVIRQGEIAEEMYFVRRGTVHVSDSDPCVFVLHDYLCVPSGVKRA